MKTAFVNADIYTGQNVLFDHAVVVEGDRIHSVVPEDSLTRGKDLQCIDLGGASIAPGFIDTQVNGGGGILLNEDPTQEGISRVADAHLGFGVTSIMPTIFTETEVNMGKLWDAHKRYISSGGDLVLGVHFEGPLINADKAGVHDKAKISRTSETILRAARDRGDSCIIVTLAPETVDAATIRQLVGSGVRVLAGHTKATLEEMEHAFANGVCGVTHIFNAMTGPGSRDPGVVTASLLDDSTYASIIVDGHHVHFQSVRLAWRSKARGKLYLVTDAMPPVGSTVSTFCIGDLKLKSEGGRCVTADGVLGGAAIDLASCVRHCVQKVGIPKEEALRMASTYVAQMLGIDTRYGYIRPGFAADMVVINNEIGVLKVIKAGKIRKS